MEHLSEHIQGELELVILAVSSCRDSKSVLSIERADDGLDCLSRDMMALVNNDAIPLIEEALILVKQAILDLAADRLDGGDGDTGTLFPLPVTDLADVVNV